MTSITHTPSTDRASHRGAGARVARRDITRILRMIRPHYRSHGGGVELVDIRGGEVVVRLTGTASRGTIDFHKNSGVVERIVRSRMPEVHTMTVV